MIIIYLIGVAIIIKWVHYAFKCNRMTYYDNFIEVDRINIRPSIETPIDTPIEIPVETPVEIPKSLGKNTWLYPTDSFGKMEKGREL